MNERRIARIEQQIKERIATLLVHGIADPRLGFVTISRVSVDREMSRCLVYWSILGDDKKKRLSASALEHATGFLRRAVAQVLHTRTVPKLEFRFDESVLGVQRMQALLNELRDERDERDDRQEPEESGGRPPEPGPLENESEAGRGGVET